MQRYGYTPTSLAKKMGVYVSTVSRLIDGNPTVEKLDELARWIGCQRWEFFADEMEIADVIEYFKDDMQAEIDRRIAEAVEAKEKEMTEQAETQAKEYEQRISELQHQLDTREPSRQGALVCPNCGRPFVIKVIATASTE